MREVTPKLKNWASIIDQGALDQALKASRLDVVDPYVALMPDAHLGIGATIGSVIPTRGAVIPSAVGVDIGCGMAAVETNLRSGDLPDRLDRLLGRWSEVMPAGLGKWHATVREPAERWLAANPLPVQLSPKQERKTLTQLGTLGSGNHFVEVCRDERDTVWILLHSGSRGIGNELAVVHIDRAKRLHRDLGTALEDPDLAYFVQDTPEFDEYVRVVLWAQRYALANRAAMLDAALPELFGLIGRKRRPVAAEVGRINCHHNYAELEPVEVGGGVMEERWVTRKGAIRAGAGDLGLIPGSMGTRSYIVRGLGNPASFHSCSHGAGRAMSRSAARKTITPEVLAAAMGERTWLKDKAGQLVDEAPGAYKDIDVVMGDQRDLVEIVHALTQVVNYKGVS